MKKDGSRAAAGETLLRIEGDGRSILMAERVALNFLQHLSGIRDAHWAILQAVRGYPVAILDTSKTLPGWRALQNGPCRSAEGPTTVSLADGMLVKDNHLCLYRKKRPSVKPADSPRADGSRMPIIVEVESLADVAEALTGQADIILLDNMTPVMVKKAVRLIKGRALGGSLRWHHLEKHPCHGSSRRRSHFHRRAHPFRSGSRDDVGAPTGSA